MSRAGFEKLEREVAGEYRARGFPRKRAEYIGRATAGKVARLKRRKKAATSPTRRKRSAPKRRAKVTKRRRKGTRRR